mmetsp:Transcript_28006/g.53309  ORF Transcript_28006/g.53309 Transcript_28006/m.53309 type:complete len:120 (-) Transcript_28006:1259-1618(-)
MGSVSATMNSNHNLFKLQTPSPALVHLLLRNYHTVIYCTPHSGGANSDNRSNAPSVAAELSLRSLSSSALVLEPLLLTSSFSSLSSSTWSGSSSDASSNSTGNPAIMGSSSEDEDMLDS